MKSFAILRTNVGLTTNIKIMIDTNYKLSLDSIESNMNLSFDKFKKVTFNKSSYYDELIPYFYKDLPVEMAYSIKYENDAETMSNDFSYQYDELYNYGARNIIDNKNYLEEYEYFAPLYITKTGLPKKFIVFRVDGPGIGTLTTTNFRTEIINKLKTVKLFDLTKESIFGEWLHTNFIDNKYFPDSPLEIDFRNLEFCRWNGIDYQNGGYTSKSLFIDDILDEEKEIFQLEKFVFDSYKNNKVVFPNILNLSFLFDDTPSTPEQKRLWSINRYYGFYLDDLELVTTISSYIPVPLKSDIVVLSGNDNRNILSSPSGYPFEEVWTDKKPFYVEYNGKYYKVEQYTETITNQLIKVKNTTGNTSVDRMERDLGFSSSKKQASSVKVVSTKNLTTNTKSAIENYGEVIVTKYRIISDLDFSGMTYSSFNKNFGEIKDNILKDMSGNSITIDNFDSSDIWLINIDGVYHNLINSGTNSISVNSDYSFQFNENSYTYKVNGVEKTINTIVDFNNPPTIFNIYKVKLTDIKDFDDKLVDTEYSKYEYEKLTDLTNTDETKMYFEDLTSRTDPRDLDDFFYKNEVVKIPVSSEYTANYETFKIDDVTGNLSELWRKNSVYCRFGFQNSISGNDVPYLLNNSLIFEDYNRTANVSDIHPKRIERNLDYFYTINSATASYLHHTLHVENFNSDNTIDNSFKFDLEKYLNQGTYSYDYFSYFFSKQTQFLNGDIKKNTIKYSYFNVGDDSVPNHSLFRGIRFDIYKVEGVTLNSNNQIDKINISTNNDFVDYKMSVLLSDNDRSVTNTGSLTQSSNDLQWIIIDEWKMDKIYEPGSVVIFDDILYTNTTTLGPCGPTINLNGNNVISNPGNQGWNLFSNNVPDNKRIFWSKFWSTNDNSINSNNCIYNFGEYWERKNTGYIDFWIPPSTDNVSNYGTGSIVMYNNKVYISNTYNNNFHPNQKQWIDISTINKFDFNTTYSKSDMVIDNSYYYISLIDNNKNSISNSLVWGIVSVVPNSDSFSWKLIEIWNPTKKYESLTYVVHNDVLYRNTLIGNQMIELIQIENQMIEEVPKPKISYSEILPGFEPGVFNGWERRYSLVPDTDFLYNELHPKGNPIILLNDRYYMSINESTSVSTLDNGIIIYINKKWKNILVNINISDNTYTNVSSTNRDDLYNELYKKLTATNFMVAINDITNKYGFTDYVSYVVIDEDNTISKYSYTNNIVNLPYIIKCEGPDSLDVKIQSLLKRPIYLPNPLNPFRKLENGKILNINQLNYYNGNPVGVNIIENQFAPKVTENYHGSKNILKDTIYRFSGYYMPLFYDIELFKRDYEYKQTGNYLFDTTLTNFGIVKERKVRKINRKGSILKLKDNPDEKSIYPMLDEFGYSIYDFFIFSSTWDLKYYLETSTLSKANKDYLEKYTIDENIINKNNIVIPITIPTNIGPSN